MQLILYVVVAFAVLQPAATQQPTNYGSGGIYPCRCQGSTQNPNNCDSQTGSCPTTHCSSGAFTPSYKGITSNCQIENIALRKSTTQSSTYYGGSSDRAVDGDIRITFSQGSCTHTSDNQNGCDLDPGPVAWWRVDLSAVTRISAVWLLNRDDFENRFSSIVVRVSNSTTNWQHAPICYSFGANPTTKAAPWYRKLCDSPLVGRYVRVERSSCQYDKKPALTLCEVVIVDNIYIAASFEHLGPTSVRFKVNEAFYNEDWTYHTILTSKEDVVCGEKQVAARFTKTSTGSVIEFTQLSLDTEYDVQIQPSTRLLAYGSPTTFTFTTPAGPPLQPPSGLNIEASSRSAVVIWNALECRHWQGDPGYYQLNIVGENMNKTHNESNTQMTVASLKPYTHYTVKVRSVNTAGHSQWTTNTFRSLPDLPDPPTQLQLMSSTDTTFTLRWQKPADFNGLPGQYLVNCVADAINVSKRVDDDVQEVQITGMVAGKVYVCKVFSSTTGAGFSSTSASLEHHTKPPSNCYIST